MVSTLFFTSFLEKLRVKEIYNIFKGYGEINEVIIQAKRDIRGRRYTFVWIFRVHNERLLATKLDNIFLGNVKLHANLHMFTRTLKGSFTRGRKDGDGTG